MKIPFAKYHGTGNDFVMIDDRSGLYSGLNKKQIAFLCNRHFGIGADGLIMISGHSESDFRMRYFNSDGNEASMCGNGGRCTIAFAKKLGMIGESCSFDAPDGIHHGTIHKDGTINLSMNSVNEIKPYRDKAFFLDTGSPHLVIFHDSVRELELIPLARSYRYSPDFAPGGCNVNFAERCGEKELMVRTYERGVEDETLSCGTGVTASALALAYQLNLPRGPIKIKAKGGSLQINFLQKDQQFSDIILSGPATHVFSGEINLDKMLFAEP